MADKKYSEIKKAAQKKADEEDRPLSVTDLGEPDSSGFREVPEDAQADLEVEQEDE